MAGRANRRFQSAAALMVLLLALAVNVAANATFKSVDTGGALMHRSLYSSAFEECLDEATACVEDSSCLACEETYMNNFDGCTDGDPTCDEFQEVACCTMAGEAEECYTDTKFTAWRECYSAAFNPSCSYGEYPDFSECNGAIGRTTAWGLPSTLISAAVGALLVAAFGSSVA